MIRPALFAGLVLASALPVSASASPELARANNCMACHAAERKMVGPAYSAIAAKYAGQSGAVELLATKIRQGGVGVWGAVPMPQQPQVDATEAQQLAQWILSLKK